MVSPHHASRVPMPLVNWWQGKAPRERRFLVVVAGTALAGAVWALVWQPLVSDLATMRAGQHQRASALAEARRMADEMTALARSQTPASTTDVRASLDRILAQHGLRASVTQLTWQEGRAHLVFGAVAFDSLVRALEALQRDARLRVVEAALTARVEPRTVRAELTLAR